MKELLKDALEETGVELRVSAEELRALIVQEASRLLLAQGEPGFARVLRASRDRVLLEAGIRASERASAMDQRIVGIVQGLLFKLAGG